MMLMRGSGAVLSAFLLLGWLPPTSCRAQSTPSSDKRPVDYVNGLVGSAPLDNQKLIGNAPPPGEPLYTGMTSPGAVLPYGSTDISPINADLPFQYPSGVNPAFGYLNPTMVGFSSGGAGGPTVMPVVGDWTVPPQANVSTYDKASEKSSPGYYSVYLDTVRTRVEMTATTWTGLYRFTFPATTDAHKAHLVLDMGGSGGDVEIVGDHVVRGHTQPGGQGRGGSGRGLGGGYFVAEFSRPFQAFGTFREIPPAQERPTPRGSLLGQKDVEPNARTISGPYAGAYLQFATTVGEQVLVKVAHGPSYAVAEERLQSEDPGWDFDRVRKQAEDAWAKKLNLIEVTGGTEKEKTLFYSCLYFSFAKPRLIARKGEQFTDRDGTVRAAEHDIYSGSDPWDGGFTQTVLHTLLDPGAKVDVLRSDLDAARESGYMGSGGFNGDGAVLVYLSDWERGLNFHDWAAAYEYLRKNAMDVNGPRAKVIGGGSPEPHNFPAYLQKGWIPDIIPPGNPSPPYAGGTAGVATTLEYSMDDYALALYAKRLGKEDDYQMFLKRAHNYQNMFDPSIGFMRGRTADGNWMSPLQADGSHRFDPQEPYYNFMMKEASGWSMLWLVPYDVQGLINLMGGREKFAAKLDEFFGTPYTAKGICRDCTGMIGQYAQGNEPDFQVPYYHDWAGEPWKTQELTRKSLALLFGSDQSGLAFPGMDDGGETSSWYVFSALGFYPADPTSPDYIIGSPVFDQATVHMGNGKDFTIVARNNSAKNIYIQSATLNGKAWNKPWFSHSDIAGGAKLVLNMGPEPNKNWGSALDAVPPSMSKPN
jgi:predicted alpha-1,2-mannosidase